MQKHSTASPPQSLSEQIQKVGKVTNTRDINGLSLNNYPSLLFTLEQFIIQFSLYTIGHDTLLHLSDAILLSKV
jgi:hypothetical protein